MKYLVKAEIQNTKSDITFWIEILNSQVELFQKLLDFSGKYLLGYEVFKKSFQNFLMALSEMFFWKLMIRIGLMYAIAKKIFVHSGD